MNTSKTFLNDFFKSQPLWLHLRQGFRILMIISLAVLLWSEANAQTGDPDIDVRGRDVSIVNGDDTPSRSDATDFGSKTVGETTGEMWMIYNTGTATLNLTGTPKIQISGPHAADFKFLNIYNSTLAPGANTEVDMAFTPSAPGLRTATITIPNDDPDENPFVFAIQGTGLPVGAPEIEVQGGSPLAAISDAATTPEIANGTDWGEINVGSGAVEHTFSIQNTGAMDLNLTGSSSRVVVTGEGFNLVTDATTPVAANGSATFTIGFTPSAPGVMTGTVSIANDDADENPYNFVISATVVDQVAPVIVPVPGFTTIWLATSCYHTYTVTQCVASVSDNCASLTLDDVVISLVTSDEEEDAPGIGDGFTKKDIVIAADGKSVKLRRERNIFRNGRVYTIHFSVNDGNGNTGTATYLVTAPICPVTRPAVDDGPLYSVNGALSKSLDLEDEQLEGEFVETIPPEAFVLEQNYPNPFNPQTLITYTLPFDATVSLKVYDGLGREVRELVNTSQAAGVYQAIFDGQGLASGVYYYTIKAFDNTGKTFSQMKRMILTK